MGTVLNGGWPAVVAQNPLQQRPLPNGVVFLRQEAKKSTLRTAREEYLRSWGGFHVICMAFMDERRDGNACLAEGVVAQTKAFLDDTVRLSKRLAPQRRAQAYVRAVCTISANLARMVQLLELPMLGQRIYTLEMERRCFEEVELLLDGIEDETEVLK